MKRRTLLVGLAAQAMWPARRVVAMEKPFKVSLVGDAFTGDSWLTGIRITLDDGWKTYWRMPGDSGIPPVFSWNGGSGDGLVEVKFPLPSRFHDAAGETVGYHDEVIFPVLVKQGEAMPQILDLDLFFGVCSEVCIPAQARVSIELGTAMRDPEGSHLVEQWMGRVPVLAEIVDHAEVVLEGGKPELKLRLKQPASDIFVEWDGPAYFHAPRFSADGLEARLPIANVRDAAALAGAMLRLTIDQAGKGLEQSVVLP